MNRIQLAKEENSKLAGVCQGLADHFQIDAFYIRMAFVLAAVFGMSGGIIYFACWLCMEKAPEN